MDNRGGVNWAVILIAPVGVILLVAMFPILDEMLALGFTTIDSSANVYYGSLIKLLLGIIPFVLVIGLIWTVIKNLDTRTSDFGPPPEF